MTTVFGMLIALALSLFGSLLLHENGKTPATVETPIGGALLIAGALLMIGIAVRRLRFAPLLQLQAEQGYLWYKRGSLRAVLAFYAVLCSVGAWVFNGDGKFTLIGVMCWFVSIVEWFVVLDNRTFYTQPLRFQWPRKTSSMWQLWLVPGVLGLILLAGIAVRFYDVNNYPPEMDSDHVEVLLDVRDVLNGNTWVFFQNNSGREAAQFYVLAGLSRLLNIPISFDLLKIGDSLIGLLMIPLAFWLGRALYGEEDRALGTLAGLIAAAFVATSFWHVMLSRAGLRMVYMTIATAFLLIFLIRAIRHNRRGDYLMAGLALGFSLYTYQSARILPIVVVVGVLLGLLMRPRIGRDRRAYIANLVALVIIAFAVFLPLARYMVDYPRSFWYRVLARVVGDEALGETPQVDTEAVFERNWALFGDNIRKTVLMFNWRGEDTVFYGTPTGTPQMDVVSGALMVMGFGVTLVRGIRRRDPADWLMPAALFLLVFPVALSFTNTYEVPSSIRASGAVPVVYALAGYTLALISLEVWRCLRSIRVQAVIYMAFVGLWVAASLANTYTYFVVQAGQHQQNPVPYRQMGDILGDFMRSTGAPGNAFYIAYEFAWDHRALGIEAGFPGWPLGIVPGNNLREAVLVEMRRYQSTPWEFRPDRQVLFLLDRQDLDSLRAAETMFPGGKAMWMRAYIPTRNFIVYVAPPIGCEGYRAAFNLNSTHCDVIDTSLPSGRPPDSQ